jgi:hypothetical protein
MGFSLDLFVTRSSGVLAGEYPPVVTWRRRPFGHTVLGVPIPTELVFSGAIRADEGVIVGQVAQDEFDDGLPPPERHDVISREVLVNREVFDLVFGS